MLRGSRVLDGDDVTRILAGIPGALESAQRGLQQAREGKTTSLDELRASR